MKKVWILERWLDRKEVENIIEEMIEWSKKLNEDENQKQATKTAGQNLIKKLGDNDGIWTGEIGRVRYNEFCYDASEYVARHKNDNYKLRVVSAYIPKESKTWIGYENPTENAGVMRYLYVASKHH